jgi:putative ABC transport system permease protein
VVLQQALILGVLGYIPGFFTALGLYSLARPAGIPAYMTVPLALLVLGMGLAMVSISGLMAVRKAKAANPADLF